MLFRCSTIVRNAGVLDVAAWQRAATVKKIAKSIFRFYILRRNKMTKEEVLKEQEAIDAEIARICGNESGLDGIADIDKFLHFDGNHKILWILKEAGRPDNYDGKPYDYRMRFAYAADYSGWKHTWGNVARVSYGINTSCENGKELPYSELPKLSLYEGDSAPYVTEADGTEIYPLDEIAIINVKKTFTTESRSNQGEINAEYNKPEVKKLLMRQVKYINPEIIIVANQVQKLAEDLAGIPFADFTTIDNLTRYAVSKERRVVIFTHHPALLGVTGGLEAYYNSIMAAVKIEYGL